MSPAHQKDSDALSDQNGVKHEILMPPGHETYHEDGVKLQKLSTDPNYRHKYVTTLVIYTLLLHLGALYGLYLILTLQLKFLTFVWSAFLVFLSAEGTVLGAHRGYSHNAFKMTTAGQVLLIILQSISGQKSIYWWARDHRLHHKYADTDADPYNSQRGFFFSHVGWVMARKHHLVTEKGKTIDVSDLENNKLIMFQKKYYLPIFLTFAIAIPTLVPVYGWDENFWTSFYVSFLYRYVQVLNQVWTINSISHMFGYKPFDARTSARQLSYIGFIAFGESWHNYHHAFPWDSKFSEYGFNENITTKFLNLLGRLGLVYDLKTASKRVVYNHSKRHGDGSFNEKNYDFKNNTNNHDEAQNNNSWNHQLLT